MRSEEREWVGSHTSPLCSHQSGPGTVACCGGWSAGCCHHWWHSRSPTGPVLCNLIWRCNCQREEERWAFTPRRERATSPQSWVQRKMNCLFNSLQKGFWLLEDTRTWTDQRVWPEVLTWKRIMKDFLIMVHFLKSSIATHTVWNHYWWITLQSAVTAFIQKSINLNGNGTAAVKKTTLVI